MSQRIQSPTRPLPEELASVLAKVRPGQRLRITHRIRIGSTRTWTTTVEGVFRDIQYLATGLATHRVPEDDIIVPTVHFTKDNGELSSVALDEYTRAEIVG